MIGYALAATSGVLLALSFPRFGHPLVAWIALTPLLVACSATPCRAGRFGYLTGVVASLGLLYWTALVVAQYGGLNLPISIVLMLLLCLAFALFHGLFGWTLGRCLEKYGLPSLMLAPVPWVAFEVLRSYTFFHFPWCALGYSQQPYPRLIQVASVTAVYGVSFAIVWTSAALAHAVIERRLAWRLGALGAALAPPLALAVYGTAVLGKPLPSERTIRVGLVQGDVRQDEKWDPELASLHFEKHLALTRQAVEQGAQLVVWPESSLPFYFDYTPEVADRLRRLVREANVHLVFGNDDREDRSAAARVYVGVKMLAPRGELALRYHKIRLVPFGEYVPMQPLLTLGGRYAARLVQQVADFAPGTEAVVGQADGVKVGAFICYEGIFPDLVRRFSKNGADLLVNVTNDAWYGRTSAPYQHFAMAALRAVENGRPLLRAANTGFSAVVDPRGRVVARTELFVPTVLVTDVPVARVDTFYTRHGDVFAWACVALTGVLAAIVGAVRRKPAVPPSQQRV